MVIGIYSIPFPYYHILLYKFVVVPGRLQITERRTPTFYPSLLMIDFPSSSDEESWRQFDEIEAKAKARWSKLIETIEAHIGGNNVARLMLKLSQTQGPFYWSKIREWHWNRVQRPPSDQWYALGKDLLRHEFLSMAENGRVSLHPNLNMNEYYE